MIWFHNFASTAVAWNGDGTWLVVIGCLAGSGGGLHVLTSLCCVAIATRLIVNLSSRAKSPT